jgi:hypothetical protein
LIHLIDIEGVALRVEGQLTKGQTTLFGIPRDGDAIAGRAYLTLRETPRPEFADRRLHLPFQADAGKAKPFDLRIGLSWQPAAGQWLRLGFRRQHAGARGIAGAGRRSAGAFATPTSRRRQAADDRSPWDAEWTDLFHVGRVSAPEIETMSLFLHRSFPRFCRTHRASEGHIDMVSLSANAWLNDQFGAFARATFADLENEDNQSRRWCRIDGELRHHLGASGQIRVTLTGI